MRNNYFSKVLMLMSVMFFCNFTLAKATICDDTTQRLKFFYERYYQLMNSADSTDYVDKVIKLVEVNCTSDFASSIKNEMTNGAGADFVAYDYVDAMVISTLAVTKSNSYYEVTFNANVAKADGGSETKKIKLAVYLKNGLISDVKRIKDD